MTLSYFIIGLTTDAIDVTKRIERAARHATKSQHVKVVERDCPTTIFPWYRYCKLPFAVPFRKFSGDQDLMFF